MPVQYVKGMLAAVWVAAMLVIAYAAGITSASGWTVLGGLTVVPCLIMWWSWKDPRQTMSERIHAARE